MQHLMDVFSWDPNAADSPPGALHAHPAATALVADRDFTL